MRKLVLPGVLLLLLGSAAFGHDHWIRNGRFFSPVDGQHCCGDHDCFEIKAEDVSERGGDYFIRTLNETVPAREVQWSKDGNYWRCKKADGSRRCFFAPPPGV
jgi:hypothetical protein